MTREEEIDKAGLEWFSQVKKYDADVATAFLAGAQWADEHPKRITYEALENVAKGIIEKDWQEQQDKYWAMIKGNLERSLRAKFTLKACEWLYEYNRKQADKMFGTVHTADVTINVAEFRKAMEGGENENN